MKNKAEVDSRYNKSDTMVSFSEMTTCSLIIYFLVSYDGDDGDDELFLWNDWPTKAVKSTGNNIFKVSSRNTSIICSMLIIKTLDTSFCCFCC